MSLKAHELIMDEEFNWHSSLGLMRFNQRRPIFTYKNKMIKEPASNAWRKALKRADIKMTFHDLRHTWTSRKLEQGMSPAYVQHLGGWSSSKMMQRYTHIDVRNLDLKKYGY
jgi:integrase